MGIIYPLTEFGIGPNRRQWSRASAPLALLVAVSLTRFATFHLMRDVYSETVIQAFLRDRVVRSGDPGRIVLDQGGRGFDGSEWGNLSHVCGRKYIRAPKRASYQDGLSGQSARPLKATNRSIAQNDGHRHLTQEVIALADIAKNQAPRVIAGPQPAFSADGRCDIATGSSTCMWGHDPMSHDSLIPQMNSSRNTLDDRNAITQADSENGVIICLSRNLPDGQWDFPLYGHLGKASSIGDG